MPTAVSTGITGLDEVLSGGFQPGSCNLVEGVPGTGKTTVGIQFIWAGAQAGEPGIIITFEEFPERIQRDALNLGWDLAQLEADNKLRIMCTSPQVFLDQLQDVDGIVEATITEIGAKRLLMDSVSHLSQIDVGPSELRALVYSMMNGLRRAGLTSVIATELQTTEADEVPFEEYLADCVVRLRYDMEGDGRRRRYVEVLKSRGVPHIPGKHMFELTDEGPKVYPGHRPSPRDKLVWEQGLCRTPTGVPGLDEMLGGGLICGFSCLVAGSAGVGKTTLGLQFACHGASLGERGIYVSFEESPQKLGELARGYGLPLQQHQQDGLLEVTYESPLNVRSEKFVHDLTAKVQQMSAKRVVIDSLTDLTMSRGGQGPLRDTVYSVVDALEEQGVTSVLITEVPEVFGQTHITGEHISIIVDGIILLKYVEMESQIRRAVSVLKMRGSDHDKGIRQFDISSVGMTVQSRFEGTEGLMAGSARATTIELAVRSFSEFDEKLNEELLERFAQLHPRVKPAPLNIPYNPDEARDVVMRAMHASQTGLSVIPLCMYWMPEAIEPDRLSPLNDVLPPARWRDHIEGLVEPAVVDEQLYGVPAIALCGVLLYRRDLLEESGFSSPPRTWEELIHQANAVCQANRREELIGFEFPAYIYEGLSSTFLVNLWSNGGGVVDDEGQMALDSENALQALTHMRDLIHTHKIAPPDLTSPSQGIEPQKNFLEGRTVFLWMLPNVLQGALRVDSPVRDRVGIAPPPIGPLGTEGHSFLGGWHYAIPTGAAAPSAARDFIRFITGYDIQKERALRGGPLPTLKALYDDQEILAFNPHYSELKDILAKAKSREKIPNYAKITKAIQRHVYPVVQGRADPAEALEALCLHVAELMSSD